ncbi:hypothetical protein WJX77_011871 [Trebouxia sp. C0004]
MSSQTQVENVQQQIEGAAQEVSEVKASLSAAKHAGDGDEVNFLRIQLEQLYKKEVALREKENLLLRAQQGGGPCSEFALTTCSFTAIVASVIEIYPFACTLVGLFG